MNFKAYNIKCDEHKWQIRSSYHIPLSIVTGVSVIHVVIVLIWSGKENQNQKMFKNDIRYIIVSVLSYHLIYRTNCTHTHMQDSDSTLI